MGGTQRRKMGNDGRKDFTFLFYHISDQRGCV
jgi:hypothetical protein